MTIATTKFEWKGRKAAVAFANSGHGQKITQPSMAFPEQSVSLKEIAYRSLTGQQVVEMRKGIFEEEGVEYTGVDIRTLDLVDFQRMRLENQKKIQQLSEEAKEEAAKKRAEKQAEAKKKHEDLKAEIKAEMEVKEQK